MQESVSTNGSEPPPRAKKSLDDAVKDLEERARKAGMSEKRIEEMRSMGKGHAQLLMRQSELETYLDAN